MMVAEYSIPPSEADIGPATVARLMGLDPDHIPEPYNKMIRHELDLIARGEHFRGGYRIAHPVVTDTKANGITVEGVFLNTGKRVTQYLKNSVKLALFLCTAGKNISMRSREYIKTGQHLEGYIADLIGSLLAEKAMDFVHGKLTEEMKRRGLKVSNRYSPGYCNWNVEDQHKLFRLLPENFCGVSLSKTAMMHPMKSVSGVIGIGKDIRFATYDCKSCSGIDCIYRDMIGP